MRVVKIMSFLFFYIIFVGGTRHVYKPLSHVKKPPSFYYILYGFFYYLCILFFFEVPRLFVFFFFLKAPSFSIFKLYTPTTDCVFPPQFMGFRSFVELHG